MEQTFIGDVHYKYGRYSTILKNYHDTIQVGDMGVGFFKYSMNHDIIPDANPPHRKMVAGNHRFIRGNHDNPSVCRRHSQWIEDGHTENGMMFIGSAKTADIEGRKEGMDWWPDEELSPAELDGMIEKYREYKPIVMATHDCPESIARGMPRYDVKRFDENIIRRYFDHMLEIHKPMIWVFGHWHHSLDVMYKGTRFICLNELEVKTISF